MILNKQNIIDIKKCVEQKCDCNNINCSMVHWCIIDDRSIEEANLKHALETIEHLHDEIDRIKDGVKTICKDVVK